MTGVYHKLDHICLYMMCPQVKRTIVFNIVTLTKDPYTLDTMVKNRNNEDSCKNKAL